MFNNLTDRLSLILRNIGGRGRITEKNIKETLREVRIALLEADVALPVLHNFIDCVKKKAMSHEVNKSLKPGQEFIKIVHNELISAMGKENKTLNLAVQPPAILIILGLYGAGKTTSVGKLGKFLREKYKKRVLVVSADIYRPMAIKQLEILAKQASIDFLSFNNYQTPIDIVRYALKEARLNLYDVLLIDTAGFLHINDKKIDEINQIITLINPIEILFVVDAMMGQDAANIAKIFNEIMPLTGIILTKIDSDTRGGAALSILHITGKPIKFLGVGEKIEALEPFQPKRIASRILGMGDVLSLIEDIENKINNNQAKNLANKLKKGEDFNLADFLEQLYQIKKLGGIANLICKLPGLEQIPTKLKSQIDDNILLKMETIINSMTLKERANPSIIKGSRKRRIAAGCGMQVQDVNNLLKHLENMQRTMKKLKNSGIAKIMHNIKNII